MIKTLKLPLDVESELKKVSKVAGYLWQREWAERNAGNISMNLTSFFSKEEVKGPLLEQFDQVDSDKDGFVSKEELESAEKDDKQRPGNRKRLINQN